MALFVSQTRCTTLVLRYVERKPDGSFQYRRRIPKTLRDRYGGKCFFVRSLRRDEARLGELSSFLTGQLDSIWHKMLNDSQLDLGERSIPDTQSSIVTTFSLDELSPQGDHRQISSSGSYRYPTMSDCLSIYLSMHSNGSTIKFEADNSRAVATLIERIGDLQINLYVRSQAEDYRDNMLRTQSSGTVRRRLRMINAIINKAIKEKQLQILNPFEGLGIAGEGDDETKRVPFTIDEIRIVLIHCHNLNDDIRHIIALQTDTGCRVAEIVGLRLEDVVLNHPIPHIRIRPWGKVRTLKTTARVC